MVDSMGDNKGSRVKGQEEATGLVANKEQGQHCKHKGGGAGWGRVTYLLLKAGEPAHPEDLSPSSRAVHMLGGGVARVVRQINILWVPFTPAA